MDRRHAVAGRRGVRAREWRAAVPHVDHERGSLGARVRDLVRQAGDGRGVAAPDRRGVEDRAPRARRASRYIPLMPTAFTKIHSPLGELTLVASDTGLTAVHFPTSREVPPLHVVERLNEKVQPPKFEVTQEGCFK